MSKLTTDELNTLFPEGIPLAVVKLIFPEKSEPLTVDELRFFLKAVSNSDTEFEYRIEIGGDEQGNRWGTDTWVVFKVFRRGTTADQVNKVFKDMLVGYRAERHGFFRITRRPVPSAWSVVE